MGFDYEAQSFEVICPAGKTKIYCEDCGSKSINQRRKYTPDFFLNNGRIIETKGRFTANDRRLVENFVQQYPELDYCILFDRDSKIAPSSATRYSDWCDARGIDYDFKEVPDRWLRPND